MTTTYVFDPFDRTVSQTTSGTAGRTTAFTYLGLDSTLLRETVDGKTDKDYQYLAGGQRATQIKHKDGGVKEYSQYVTSPRGDVEAITKDDGRTRSTYGYTAYGSDDTSQMTDEDKPGAEGEQKDDYNSFRFNSSRWDSASGTYDRGFRNYDPGLNRFLTRDSYGGALNDMALARPGACVQGRPKRRNQRTQAHADADPARQAVSDEASRKGLRGVHTSVADGVVVGGGRRSGTGRRCALRLGQLAGGRARGSRHGPAVRAAAGGRHVLPEYARCSLHRRLRPVR